MVFRLTRKRRVTRGNRGDWRRGTLNVARRTAPALGRWLADRAVSSYKSRGGLRTKTRLRMAGGGGHSMRRSQGREQRHGSGSGGDQMTSSFRNVHKDRIKVPKLAHWLAPQMTHSTVPGYVTSLVGLQNAYMVPLYDGTGAIGTRLLSRDDIEDMHAQYTAAESVPVGATNTLNTRRLKILKVTAKVTLKNMSNIPIDVILFDIVPKKDSQNTSNTRPIDEWNLGVGDERITLTGDTPALFTVPGTRPFQSQRFCQFFTVKKSTKFTLGAGSEHIHYITIKPGYLLNRAFTAPYVDYRGLTTQLMAIIRGGLVHDATNGTTVSAAALSTTAEVNYKYTSVMWNRTLFTNWNTLSLTTAAANNTILEDTDAPATAMVV